MRDVDGSRRTDVEDGIADDGLQGDDGTVGDGIRDGPTDGQRLAMGAVFRDVRVRDPAARDQDGKAWRRGRFMERVRREWNVIPTSAVDATRQGETYALGALARVIQSKVGGEVDPIQRRLEEFASLETLGAEPVADPLVRPGSP